MATPLLFMKTDRGGNEEPKPGPTKTRGRKPAGKAAAGKKKVPQRGMGVAQLERLRLEEWWKRKTQTTIQLDDQLHPQPAFSCPDPVNYPHLLCHAAANSGGPTAGDGGLWGWDTGLVLQRLGNNGGFHGGGSSGLSFVDPSWVGAPVHGGSVVEASKELSSMPKLQQSVTAARCEVCFKKKRFSSVGKKLIEPVNFALKSAGSNQLFDGKIINNNDRGVELLAVHRKGKEAVGEKNVLMEFEFFPGKNGRSTPPKVLDFATEAYCSVGSEGSYAAAAADDDSCCDANTSNLVDLSLKLSY